MPEAITQPASTQPSTRAVGIETRPILAASRPGGSAGAENVAIRKGNGSPLEGWGQTVIALLVVLAIILLLRIVLKRFSRPQMALKGGAVEVLARTSIQPRQHLLLVRLGRRLLLLGSTPSGLSTLSVVSDPEEVAELTESAMGEDLARLAARKAKAPSKSRETGPADKEEPAA